MQCQTSDASLTLIFDQPLPAGQYSLVVPAEGGLTDLAGRPVTAAGEPSGVLARSTGRAGIGSSIPNNLGVLWPSRAKVIWPTEQGAFSKTSAIAAGKSVTYRWVVSVPGIYILQTQDGAGSLSIQNSGDSGTTVLTPRSAAGLNTYLLDLGTGVYTLRLTNLESRPAFVSWVLKVGSLDWEKIVDNGVGQGSALSLLMFSPAPAGASANAGSLGRLEWPGDLPIRGLESVRGVDGAGSLSLLVTANTGPLGQPGPDAGMAPAGQAGQIGMVPVADRSRSLGLGAGFLAGAILTTVDGEGVADPAVESSTRRWRYRCRR